MVYYVAIISSTCDYHFTGPGGDLNTNNKVSDIFMWPLVWIFPGVNLSSIQLCQHSSRPCNSYMSWQNKVEGNIRLLAFEFRLVLFLDELTIKATDHNLLYYWILKWGRRDCFIHFQDSFVEKYHMQPQSEFWLGSLIPSSLLMTFITASPTKIMKTPL